MSEASKIGVCKYCGNSLEDDFIISSDGLVFCSPACEITAEEEGERLEALARKRAGETCATCNQPLKQSRVVVQGSPDEIVFCSIACERLYPESVSGANVRKRLLKIEIGFVGVAIVLVAAIVAHHFGIL